MKRFLLQNGIYFRIQENTPKMTNKIGVHNQILSQPMAVEENLPRISYSISYPFFLMMQGM